jgi:hypothetical protein
VSRERLRQICNWIVAIAIVQFVVFVGTILAFGGDALTGRVDDGHWFLGNHGQYVEVTRGTWLASAIIGRTLVYGTFPLAVIAAVAKPRTDSRARPRIWWKKE